MVTTNTQNTSSNQSEPQEQRKRVGDILREARLARDEELPEVAKLLRIRLEFMSAIEESRPKDLPGTAYALGFVRSYAAHLNLDAKPLVEQFKAEVEEMENLTQLNFPEPLPAKSVPGGALVFIGLLLFGLFYGLWYYMSTQDMSIAELVPELPKRLQQLISSDEGETAGEAEEATVDDDTSAMSDPSPAEEEAPANTIAETSGTMTAEDSQPAAAAVAEAVEEVVEEAAETVTTEAAPAEQAVTETVQESAVPAVAEVADEAGETVAEAVDEAGESITEAAEETAAAAEGATVGAASAAIAASQATVQEATVPETTVSETNVNSAAERTETAAEEAVEEIMEEAGGTVADASAGQAESSRPAATTVASIANSLPTAREEKKVHGAENADARVIITARSTAWIEVSAKDGEILLTGLLNGGDIYRVPNQGGITLIAGDAGALEITVDGRKVPAIGDQGAVVRDVSLDPETLMAGQ